MSGALASLHGTLARDSSSQGPTSPATWQCRQECGFAGRVAWAPSGQHSLPGSLGMRVEQERVSKKHPHGA